MIAFYYGLTGFACAVYYRTSCGKSAKNLLLMGVVAGHRRPGAGVRRRKSIYDLSKPANSESGDSWLGLGPAAGHRRRADAGRRRADVPAVAPDPTFFQRKRETVPPEVALRGSQHALDAETAALQEKVGD